MEISIPVIAGAIVVMVLLSRRGRRSPLQEYLFGPQPCYACDVPVEFKNHKYIHINGKLELPGKWGLHDASPLDTAITRLDLYGKGQR